MPIRIDVISANHAHKSECIIKNMNKKMKKQQYDKGTEIVRNANINTISKFAFNILDYMSPLFAKHQKFGKLMICAAEHLIKFSGNLSK